jgi:vacuolar iron transporter family protein
MTADDIKRYQDNLRDELDGATLYTQIAAAESDPLRRDLFLQLAQAEARHAGVWREKLAAAGIKEQRYVPSFRTRLLGKLAQRFGPGFVMPTIAAAEFSDRNKYASQGDARSISAEERGHAAVVQQMARTSAGGSVSGADRAGRTLAPRRLRQQPARCRPWGQ